MYYRVFVFIADDLEIHTLALDEKYFRMSSRNYKQRLVYSFFMICDLQSRSNLNTCLLRKKNKYSDVTDMTDHNMLYTTI
jgi:hypothetical protein